LLHEIQRAEFEKNAALRPMVAFVVNSNWTGFFPFSVPTNFPGSAIITRFVLVIKSRMFCPIRSFLTISDAAIIVLVEYIFHGDTRLFLSANS
jgi:hypothetical protein